MRRLMVFVCLLAATLAAQRPGPGMPPGGDAPPMDAVKSALMLTDTQITQLRQLQADLRSAVQPVMEQIAQHHQALRQALSSATANPTELGQILLDIEKLRAQIRDTRTKFQQQAVALLTTDQQVKLKTQEQAAKLRPAIAQATALNLLVPPDDGAPGDLGPRGFVGPGDFSGRQFGRGAGPR